MSDLGPDRPAGPVPVIVNAGGGAASRLGKGLKDAVRQAFAEAGLPISLSAVQGEDIARAVASAAGQVVIVGGGDGTLSAAAGALVGTGRTLAILPLGTRNHLARELGVPLDLAGAARLAQHGAERLIDLGRAGDRVFVNNLSVGLYPRIVHAREQGRGAMPKWLATIPALASALRRLHTEHFRLEWDGAEHRIETPLLFVGNNRYTLDSGRLGQRESLSDGVLSLAAVRAPGWRSLAWTALKLLVGRSNPEEDFAALEELRELCICGHQSRHVALDGELATLKFPLRITVLAGGLSVRVPFPQSGD